MVLSFSGQGQFTVSLCDNIHQWEGLGTPKAQTARYGTGPDEEHEPEAKICTGPHREGQKAALIHITKVRDPHQICHLKSLSQNFANHCSQLFFLQIFINKLTPAELCQQNFTIF